MLGTLAGLELENSNMNHREAFLAALTVDSATRDRRRREYNQAIFDPENGWSIWSSTDLDMVMAAYDHATRMEAKP